MNIQQLKYFIEIADTRNLSMAARNLFVTQPTLSVALKKLETDLETTLFSHVDQPFQLTDTGHLLYARGVDILKQIDQLLEDIHTMQEDTSQTIKLGITTLFSVQFMDEIAQFLSNHPNTKLSIKQDGSYKMQEMLRDKEIDIGLLSFPNCFPDEITIDALETTTKGYHVYVVVPNENPLSNLDVITFNDLVDERFSSLTSNFMIGRMLSERARFFGFQPNIVLYNDDLQVLLHSLHINHSICLLPIEYKDIGKSPNVKWIPLQDKHNYFSIGLALRKKESLSPIISEFIQTVKNN